jgi:hypothetical protein
MHVHIGVQHAFDHRFGHQSHRVAQLLPRRNGNGNLLGQFFRLAT